MQGFSAKLEIIDGNPFVHLPPSILEAIFSDAGKTKGAIPVKGRVNSKPFRQTLMKYSGHWRLYINMQMLKDSPRRIGELIEIEILYDKSDRSIEPHHKFISALESNARARQVFEQLSPSRRKEIVRYITNLKLEESVERNVKKAIDFLLGKGRFVGRDKP